jgi:type VI secretion system protein ImpE
MALLVEALRLDAISQEAEATALRNQAFELAPATSGCLDGTPFEWISDADSRLGPILEAIVNGRYYWIPFQQIRKIQLEAPTDLRDVVWMPAEFTWLNGGQASGLIPTRYPGSELTDDGLIKLARKTEWTEFSSAVPRGLGQRLLATDTDDYALMDIRKIELNAGSGQG